METSAVGEGYARIQHISKRLVRESLLQLTSSKARTRIPNININDISNTTIGVQNDQRNKDEEMSDRVDFHGNSAVSLRLAVFLRLRNGRGM